MAGGGALLGQVPSYGLSGASTEAHTTNPLFGGGGGTGRGIGTAAISQDPPPTAALGNGVSAAGVLGGGGLPPPPPPEVKIVEVMGQEDEGAGVFGALLHEPGVLQRGGGGVLLVSLETLRPFLRVGHTFFELVTGHSS